MVGVRSLAGPLTSKPTMSNNDDGSRRFRILVMLALGITVVGRLVVITATHVVPFMSTTNLWGCDMKAGFARVSKTTLDIFQEDFGLELLHGSFDVLFFRGLQRTATINGGVV